MSKTRVAKEAIVNELLDKVKNAKSIVVANLSGLTVADSQTLRRDCRANGVELFSVKKTLLDLIFKKNSIEGIEAKEMTGSLGVAICADEEVAPAKVIKAFARTHAQVKFSGGVLNGAFIPVDRVEFLAGLPSKEELLAKLVGSLNAPISGFVNVLAGNLRGLVTVLGAIKDKKV